MRRRTTRFSVERKKGISGVVSAFVTATKCIFARIVNAIHLLSALLFSSILISAPFLHIRTLQKIENFYIEKSVSC